MNVKRTFTNTNDNKFWAVLINRRKWQVSKAKSFKSENKMMDYRSKYGERMFKNIELWTERRGNKTAMLIENKAGYTSTLVAEG